MRRFIHSSIFAVLILQSRFICVDADSNGPNGINGMLAQWQGDFGADPDSDADGDSDGADFLTWQRNLVRSVATSTAGAVPEPTAWVLGVVCLTFFAWRRGGFNLNSPRRHLLPATVLICGSVSNSLAADPIRVPLADIVTTSDQEGMHQVRDIFRRVDEEGHEVTQGPSGFGISGASNAFLVDAIDVNNAIGATSHILLGARPANIPASNERGPMSGSYWLVAYLGSGNSGPLRWTVESATVEGNKIKLTYRQPEAVMVTKDIHPYFYWVPLGKLAPGTYQVELFDADEKAVTLMRRVKVEAKPK